QSLLFWGGMAALLGLLGTAVGLVITAQAVARVPDAGASLIWGGIGVTLTTLIFGLLIFLLAALAWFVLGMWSSRLARATGSRPRHTLRMGKARARARAFVLR